MSASTLTTDRQTCFQLKTSFAPCTILQLSSYDLEALQHQLGAAISRAPTFFLGAPIIIDLEKIKHQGVIDFIKLKEVLMSHHVVPIGVRNGTPEQLTLALTCGLPTLTIGKLTQSESESKENKESNKESNKEDKKKIATHPPTKIVTHPIRSGMQVYAKDADLVVTAPVSAGAELLADGNIHVYGPLRGRALAGMQGNVQARIFCRTLEAELISIAGYYLTKEDMQPAPESHGMIQIYLDNEQVRIETIS